MGEKGTVVVAVSRQIASGGAQLAQSVARRLRCKYVDRDVLCEAARNLGVDVRDLSGREEKSSGLLENLCRSFSFGTPESAYVVPLRRPVYDRDLFNAETAVIRRLATEHDSVILGRAGGHVLGNHPGLVKVFVHAPRRDRITRLMDVRRIADRDTAEREIEESDENRERFVRDMTGADWTDARNYHLCIDTSAAGFPATEEMILRIVEVRKHSLERG